MALILLDPLVSDPSAKDGFQNLCVCCKFSTEDKAHAWYSCGDPFRFWTRMAFRRPGGVLSFIDIQHLLYDSMHGCARLNSITWSTILMISKGPIRSAVLSEMKEYFGKTSPNLNIQALKSYFGPRRHLEFLKVLRRLGSGGVYCILSESTPGILRVVSLLGMIQMLLNAIETFYLYCWQLNEERRTIHELIAARADILAVMAFAKHPMWPAPHYMMNHFFEDIKLMGHITPRLWLNEKEENANKHHRRIGRATLQGSHQPRNRFNSCQVLLRSLSAIKVIKVKQNVNKQSL